jgi:hypothetical protein
MHHYLLLQSRISWSWGIVSIYELNNLCYFQESSYINITENVRCLVPLGIQAPFLLPIFC